MVRGLIFCVDGGATKSRARLVDAVGNARAAAEGGPCNPATNLDRAVTNFIALWRHCAGIAGIEPEQTGDVVLSIGAAGLYVPSARARFLAAIPRFLQTIAVSDGYAALIGAGGGKPCGLIIIGTGVAGHRLWSNGLSVQRDGWGWIGGDRGSGAWLGINALRHTLAVVDGIRAEDGLSERLLASIGGRARLAETVNKLSPDRVAALAPIVLAAADAGVSRAAAIRDRAIEHLAALALVLDIDEHDTLYVAGGLAANLEPRLAARLCRTVALPDNDAMHGCYLLAAGQAPAERIIDEVAL